MWDFNLSRSIRSEESKSGRGRRGAIAMKWYLPVFSIVLASGVSTPGIAQNNTTFALKAGAAKVDVTPAESELPKNYEGILDHIYARAIVIDNGATKAALLTLDAGGLSDPLWQNVTKRAEAELGIPAK